MMENFRNLSVLVLHQMDRDGEELLRHLRRMKIRSDVKWPPSETIPAHYDIVFCLFRREYLQRGFAAALRTMSETSTLIGIIEEESPSAIKMLMEAGVVSVISKPIHPIGLLTSMILADNISKQCKAKDRRIIKLEEKLSSARSVERAKRIVMAMKHMDEREAYDFLRNAAMARRISVEAVSLSLIEANEIFESSPA